MKGDHHRSGNKDRDEEDTKKVLLAFAIRSHISNDEMRGKEQKNQRVRQDHAKLCANANGIGRLVDEKYACLTTSLIAQRSLAAAVMCGGSPQVPLTSLSESVLNGAHLVKTWMNARQMRIPIIGDTAESSDTRPMAEARANRRKHSRT